MVVSKANKSLLSSVFKSRIRNTGESSIASGNKDIAGTSQAVKDLLCSKYSSSDLEEAPLQDRVSNLLHVTTSEKSSLEKNLVLKIPSFTPKIPYDISLRSKELSPERKERRVYKKNGLSRRFAKIFRDSAQKLGTEAMFGAFDRVAKEMSVTEYNAMIGVYLEHAEKSNDLDYALGHIEKAFELLKSMRDRGFLIEERVYGPILGYLIDMDMVDEFQSFKDVIREASPGSVERLGYYEMLLWIQLGDGEKIEELCDTIDGDNRESLSILQENYLLALCKKDQTYHLERLLGIVDITNVQSSDLWTNIFEYLGRFSLDSVAGKFLWELRESGVTNVSELISIYSTCTPNPTVEDTILKFNKMHEELDVMPSSTSYEKLVKYSCDSNEVVTALEIVEKMGEAGLIISADILHSLLHAIDEVLEFDLVRRIHSIMCTKSVKPNTENFRSIIRLCTRIKDFEGAYNMLGNLKNFNLEPNSSMFNCILAGYFREKNVCRALMVVKQMKEAGVKPDSITFGYLINNCNREDAITKYYDEMKQAGVQATKRIYMSLIDAYAASGKFEKAKQVLVDPDVPAINQNELKSVLISALASRGKWADALHIYEEMRKAECHVDPKSIISLIEYSDSNGELSTLVQLADDLQDDTSWIDGFFRMILFAVRNRKSRNIVDLLKQNKIRLLKKDLPVETHFDEVFWAIAETEPTKVQLGMDLLRFMKDELGFVPSRKCLDFLLHACVNAKDLEHGLLVWKEYQSAALPCNVLSFLRMYQVLLAAGDSEGAKALVSKIPKDDKDVQHIIEESQSAFSQAPNKKKPKKKTIVSSRKQKNAGLCTSLDR
ncbi:pentatricopeptide repeat-containing protein At4g04790, mitochondrial isoform X3 [Arabidopsis lyrata subsp. lyrata]|uniref:pentatricopeptide repeat-containing protein At4g04790, mitochondrial isoform X3 n=1 Tax=Arabidopsis lyrata subsp. lyrata TaxID=81972 RepID=UPI000A29DB72|nr:pentatricopeptide repeat-containing protein At4g04790, mitochondrial isoform X3 [Arabidopsis lyrata subsp. lyrata]|eukprot:XP_020876623.1 pentatricopeptide repeat-containing protein At4g04790, mitochondrial isoform X3 [Arabidopsis lyrata subsp. lyrata]